jgi:hypothetical protein
MFHEKRYRIDIRELLSPRPQVSKNKPGFSIESGLIKLMKEGL